MPIAWGSKEARECWDGVRKNIGEALDQTHAATERGKAPCLNASDGAHEWRRRVSPILPGYGWDECRACKAERWDR